MRRHPFDLVAFDVDGTLVGNRDGRVVWELLNRHFRGDQALDSDRYEAYMTGQITYAEWVELDIFGWLAMGATRDQIARVIIDKLYLVTGARETVAALKQAGLCLAVISGTINLTLDLLFPDHPFHEVYTNRIDFDDDGLIDGWLATPYDMAGKARALEEIATRHHIPLCRTAYVGDNTNDIEVMKRAGMALAFEPKCHSVAAVAHAVIADDLRRALPLLIGREQD
jgi:phosphoserine phosphatase